MTDINKLEQLAKAATPGPWSNEKLEDGIHEVCAHDGSDWEILICNTRREDADYIAAVNPAAILSLISQYRRMEEALRGAWPSNLLAVPDHLPDDFVFPLDVTAAELRALQAALQDQDQ